MPDSFKEFVRFNRDFLDENPLLYFFLEKTIKDVFESKTKFHIAFTILKEDVGRIVLLVVENGCLIYENGYDDGMFDAFCEQLEFGKFKRFNFAGSKRLIDALFERNGATFDLTKHRVIYKCSHVSDNFTYASGGLKMGNPQHIHILTEMGVAFSKAYDGTARSKEEAMATIVMGIRNDNIYQWEDNGNVCAMAQVMSDEYDFPVIGHFYTDPSQRNKGYGASIIHKITKGLLDAGNPYCMLVADAVNPASNRAFIKAGYITTGEYVRGYKPS